MPSLPFRTKEATRAANGDAQAAFLRALRWDKDECFEWPYGYIIKTGARHSNKGRAVASLVCEEVHGPPPQGASTNEYRVNRSCDNVRCVAPRHLSWQAKIDAPERYSHPGGTSVTREQYAAIKASRRGTKVLCKQLGLGYPTVASIRADDPRWKEIFGEEA